MTDKAIMDANQFAADVVGSANQANADMIANAMLDGLNRVTLSVEKYTEYVTKQQEEFADTFSEEIGAPLTISDYMMGVAITLVSCVENLADQMQDDVEQPQTILFEALGGISRNILQRKK
jgi:hypothetical protein